ncbi:MAG: 1-acyl-sn-glycerol-3-phosphate acyltransferase [Bacteroidaceae bacterium]|nr:1-acyl-sn-glycerol-3-phosphate acyltransferase [Bacteroidaceae bacterium]
MKALYRTYQLLIALPLGLLLTLIISLTTGIGCMLGSQRFWGYWPMRIWSVGICCLLMLPVKVEGRSNIKPGKSYVFIANHQGAFDIFLIAGYLHRPFKWMMKKSLRSVPFVGWACEKAGFIFVDKASRHGLVQTIKDAREALQGGSSMAIFPEGSRTPDGQVQPFQKGSFMLARQIGLPLVPITIDGSFQVLPRSKGFFFVERHPLRLIIHEPLAPDDEAMEKSFAVIASGLPHNDK